MSAVPLTNGKSEPKAYEKQESSKKWNNRRDSNTAEKESHPFVQTNVDTSDLLYLHNLLLQ